MKSRTDKIWGALAEIINEISINDLTKTITCFEAHSVNLLDSLRFALISCDKQAALHRQNGVKGDTAFITLSFLNSSILSGSYDLRIDFYDENFFDDISESCAYFSYAHLIPFYQQSVEFLCEKAEREFVRFMDYERDALAWKYKTEVLYKMIMTTCSLCLLHPKTIEFLPSLNVTENCVFTFGGLFNNQQLYLKFPQRAEVL